MELILPLLVAIPLGTAFIVVIMAHVKGLKTLTSAVAMGAVAAALVVSIVLIGTGPLYLFVGEGGHFAVRRWWQTLYGPRHDREQRPAETRRPLMDGNRKEYCG